MTAVVPDVRPVGAAAAPQPLLALENVEVVYEEIILALRGVNLSVAEGTCTAILGANGAGKSTLLKAISGVLLAEHGRVRRGSITFAGERIDGRSAVDIARSNVLHVMEGRRVLQHMTVEQNLIVGAHRLPRGEFGLALDRIYEQIPRLAALRKRSAGYLSGGEQQLLVIARAMLGHPRVLMIDEPSLGLAPIMIDQIFEVLRTVLAEGVTLVLVEQNATAALGIADRACVLENGRIVLEGTRDELLHNDDIKASYLGLDLTGHRVSFRDAKHYRRRKRWAG